MARLDSWKAIADHLGRDVRTVRRWEEERGLPVHRVPGEHRGGVFAFTEEIDQWLVQGADTAAVRATPARNNPRWLALVPLVAAAVAASWWWRPSGTADAVITRVDVTPAGLVAQGATGPLWTWPIPVKDRHPGRFQALVVDSGRAVVAGTLADVATLAGSETVIGGRLWRLSASGAVSWTHSLDDHRERYNGRDFSAPWVLRSWSTEGQSGQVAAAWSHEVWWPSLIQIVNPDQTVTPAFRNPGWVTSVAWVPGASGRLAVGGMSNPHDAAMAALLDASLSAAQAPPGQAEFSCDDCGDGRPLRYLVLPRSEINRTLAATINQGMVEARPGRITVRTIEVDRDSAHMGGEVVYELDPDFELRTVTYSDRYWQVHALLEAEGRLNHSRAHCPERDGPRGILEWTAASGWRTLR